jgi:hypothetical protein
LNVYHFVPSTAALKTHKLVFLTGCSHLREFAFSYFYPALDYFNLAKEKPQLMNYDSLASPQN